MHDGGSLDGDVERLDGPAQPPPMALDGDGLDEQLRAWTKTRPRRRSGADRAFGAWLERVHRHVDGALAQASRTSDAARCVVDDLLMRHWVSVRISDEPARFGSVLLRAALDLDRHEVVIYAEGLQALAERLERQVPELPTSAREIILAHELFHVLDPECPDDLAEAAAHLFTTRLLGLPFFAGLLDA